MKRTWGQIFGRRFVVKADNLENQEKRDIFDIIKENIPDGDTISIDEDEGRVVFSTVEATAKADNDANILAIAIAISRKNQKYDGKYMIMRNSDGKIRAGTIETWHGTLHLSKGQTFTIVTMERLLAEGVTVIVASDEVEATEMLIRREAVNKNP